MALLWLWDTCEKFLLIVAMLILTIIWLISLLYPHKKKTPPSPPGPRGLPLVGYLPFLGSELHRAFTELAATYGPIFKVQLGTKNCIVISSASLMKQVFRDQDVVFANRDPSRAAIILTVGASDIAFSSYGHEWRKMRKIFATEMLSTSQLKSSYYLREKHVKRMITDTYKNIGKVVDVGEVVFKAIINSMTGMVWGQTLKGNQTCTVDADFRAVLGEFMELLGVPNISDFLPLFARFDLQGIERRSKIVARRIHDIMDSAIDVHNNGEQSAQEDFLGYLLQLTKGQDLATSLTLVQVKAMLMDIIIGGMDTTVTAVEWAMSQMLKHPKVMKRVEDELTEIVGLSTCVEESDLPKLKYLKAVVKETLRLHPPLPLLVPHCSSKSTSVGGYSIPKGSQIFLNVFAIQRDPNVWESPLEFEPERFLKEDLDYLGNHLQYSPFGSGRRTCPGIPLAERTYMHVLASLLHAFKWSLPHGVQQVDLSERFGIVVKRSKPLLAVPLPRLSILDIYS